MMFTFNSAMHTPINITTFNVNGLGIDIKRQSIFNKLKGDNSVIMLQETHSITNIEKKWKMEWGVKIIFSHGNSNSKGVAIIFPPKLDYKNIVMCMADSYY